jgi:cysteine desulfurase/selenocysteine lyase
LCLCAAVPRGINLVATYFERAILKEGDEVVIMMMAHDSNFLPCEMACNQTKAILKVLPITGSGEIDQFTDALQACIRAKG